MDRYAFPDLYFASVEALGSFSGADAVEALKIVLHAGSWLRPFASRRYRAAAAHALARIGSPDAIGVLRDASANGGLGVRSAARAELARTAS
jgi:HEAT repeat protein